jgi:hypothetical protein
MSTNSLGADSNRLPTASDHNPAMKLFYTGPLVNVELLVTMLEKHGIAATQEFADPNLPDDGDLNRLAKVLVPDADYDVAHRLFYSEREDEL